MTIDSSIALGVKPVQIDSPTNALAQMYQIKAAQQQGQAADMTMQKEQRGVDDSNKLRSLFSAPGFDMQNADSLKQVMAISPTQGMAMQKAQLDNNKTRGEIDSKAFDVASKAHSIYQNTMGALAYSPNLSKDSVIQAGQGLVQAGILKPEMLAASIKSMPDDVAALKAKLLEGVHAQMTPEQLVTLFAPKPVEQSTGQQKYFVDNNPNSPTYGQRTGAAPVQMEQTPDSKATDLRTQTEGVANRANTIKVQTMIGARQDKADAGEVESPEAIEKMAKGIAAGRLAPMSSFAMLKPSGKAIMSRVLDINPTYDAGDYLSKNKALRDYGTGTQGMAVQAANTGLNHLDTIEELAKAQKNGDTRMFNTIANRLAAERGSAAPTNLAAAISMVAPEVSKMVIGAAGGQEERAVFAHNFNPNASPEQTLGGISTMRELLGGRLSEAERTYKRTTGRDDFSTGMLSPAAQKVLSLRSPAGHAPAAAALPSDIAALLQKHGGK